VEIRTLMEQRESYPCSREGTLFIQDQHLVLL